jgi:hypothetical protein
MLAVVQTLETWRQLDFSAVPPSTTNDLRHMKAVFLVVLSLCVMLLTGCGQKLTGRYETQPPAIPSLAVPGMDAKTAKQFNDQMRQVAEMSRMFLEFDGYTVRMGSQTAVTEYKYRIKGNILELTVDAMGQKTTLPMKIEPDGSISYSLLRFYRVK